MQVSETAGESRGRELLQVGGIGMLGLTLADVWRGREVQASPASRTAGRQPSCIFIFLSGGPKPSGDIRSKTSAPVNIRGPYGTISTNVPGIQIGSCCRPVAAYGQMAILRSNDQPDEHAARR